MKALSIGCATEVYKDASKCEIIRHWVEHPSLAEYSRSLRAFVHSLGDEADDEFWRRSLGPLRRLGFAFCSTPLPFSEAAAAIGTDWIMLHRKVRHCEQLFPDAYQRFAVLVEQLEELSEEVGSPFLEPLEQLHRQNGGLCVVLRNSSLNKFGASYFARTATLDRVRIVSPSQLRGGHISEVIATIGPCSWFPEHVFSAPRASAIHVILPRWIRDPWKPGPVFLHNARGSNGRSRDHRIGTMPQVGGDPTSAPSSPDEILPEELLPPMPTLSRSSLQLSSPTTGTAETVHARLCHLSGNRAVFVAADNGSSSLVIDTSEMGHSAVRRVQVSELEPGHYILLRTMGGGDFIAPLADRILGDLAEKRRSEQAEWKSLLNSAAIERFGNRDGRELSALVSSDLQSKNLSQARPANILYWMSSKCIRPRTVEDFIAILTFAGIETRAQDLWRSMRDISRAHTKAGHLIRRMLLQKIATTSLEPLERDGEMDFELGDEDGGMLSAFQITEILAEDIDVQTDRIGVLLDLED